MTVGTGYLLTLQWASASALGASIGGRLATYFFPNLGFFSGPQNYDRMPTLEDVSFSITIGFFFALAQGSLVVSKINTPNYTKTQLFFAWTVISAIGFAAMITPTWMIDPTAIVYPPLVALPIIAMLPGMIILGYGQRYFLREVLENSYTWASATLLGAVCGTLCASLSVFFLTAFAVPLERNDFGLILPGLIAGFIGVFQASRLRKTVQTSSSVGES